MQVNVALSTISDIYYTCIYPSNIGLSAALLCMIRDGNLRQPAGSYLWSPWVTNNIANIILLTN